MRVLVARPQPQADATVAALVSHGIDAVAAPMLAVHRGDDVEARVRAAGPGALLFTSAHGVAALAPAGAPADLAGLPVIAVGPATAAAARQAGFSAVESADGSAEAVVACALARLAAGAVVVHVAGRDRTGDVAERLTSAGLKAVTVEAYRAEMAERLPPDLVDSLAAGKFDAVVVGSSRTAEAFRRSLVAGGLGRPLPGTALVAISEAAAAPLGGWLEPVVISASPTGEALVEGVVALAAWLEDNRGRRPPEPAT